MLVALMDRLRPLLIRRWRKSAALARAKAKTTDVDIDSYMAGFQAGYWSGSAETAQITSGDLPPSKKNPKVH
jgi:hypothetical protein